MYKQKPKLTQVTPEDKIRLDRERPHADRIIALLRLIRYSNAVSEANPKYGKRR
jgi:hypothetical protein